jgi:hypothetical protein
MRQRIPIFTKRKKLEWLPWFCEKCKVEVKALRCPHCGKSRLEKS